MIDILTLFLETDQTKIDEAYMVFLTKLKFIIENNSLLTNQELSSMLEIFSFFYKKDKKYRNELDFYFKKILFHYPDRFSIEQKLSLLSLSDNEEILEQYIQANYEVFLAYFKSHVFVDRVLVDDLTDLYEFQIDLDFSYPDKHYQACWWYLAFPTHLLYRYFSKEIKLLEDNKIKHITNRIISSLSLEQLLDLLSTTYFSKEDIKQILKIIFSKPVIVVAGGEEIDQSLIEKWSLAFQTIGVDTSLTVLAENFDEILFSNFNYSSFFRKLVSKEEPSDVKTLFSVFFFQALNCLKDLEWDNPTKDILYLKTFQVFFTEFTRRYQDPITENTFFLIEVLFRRAIQGKDIFLMLKINHEKSLIHYYKTNEFVSSFSCSKEELDKYKAKQYLALKRIWNSNRKEKCEDFTFQNDQETSSFIQGLNLLGFELCKKICQSSKCTLKEVVECLIDKDPTYLSNVKKLLEEYVVSTSENKISLSLFFSLFDTFYSQGMKKITLSKLEKAVQSSKFFLVPYNYSIFPFLEKLNFVAKGDPFYEKIKAIHLYEEYRHRLTSTIPDIKGKYQGIDYEMVNLHDIGILSNGIGHYLLPNGEVASSCLTPNGKAASCLRHGAVNPNGRFFKVINQGKILAYSWVWRSGEVLCFDNIEITDEALKIENSEEIIFKVYQLAGNTIKQITEKEKEHSVKLVIIGRNPKDIQNQYIDSLPQVNDYTTTLYQPNCKDKLYLKDSSLKQVIIAGEYSSNLSTKNSEAIYLYQRNPVSSFDFVSPQELSERLNAIYYEYCLQHAKKYFPLNSNYESGYFNEDWFIGNLPNGNQDFYYVQNDDRLFEEIKPYLKQKKSFTPSIILVDPSLTNQKNKILNIHNFSFDKEKIKQYLDEVSNQSNSLIKLKGYSHTTSSLETLGAIFRQREITSSLYGNHDGGNGCNGGYYISVAKIGSKLHNSYATTGTMILDEDLLVFQNHDYLNMGKVFTNSSYPYRLTNYEGEYHVFQSIPLEKVNSILANPWDIEKIIQIFYLEDLYQNNIPLICIHNNIEIDKEYIKKYSRLR